MANPKSTTDQLTESERVAYAALNRPTAHPPMPQAPARAYPGRDAALAEGRDPLDPLGGQRRK